MLEQLYSLGKLLRAYLGKQLLGAFFSTLYSCLFYFSLLPAVIFSAFCYSDDAERQRNKLLSIIHSEERTVLLEPNCVQFVGN